MGEKGVGFVSQSSRVEKVRAAGGKGAGRLSQEAAEKACDFSLHNFLKETLSYQKASQPVRCDDVKGKNTPIGLLHTSIKTNQNS